MNKEKKKTTKSAKFSGLLAGLGAYSMILLSLPILGVFIALVLGIGVLEIGIFLIGSMVLLFLLGPLLAILIGRFINFRWEGYKHSKKYILNIISTLPVLVVLLILVMANGKSNDKENRKKSNSYKYGTMDFSPTGYLEKDHILEENGKEGRPLEDSEKYWNSKGEPVDSIEEANKK